jgi:hypothetical protein
MILNKGLSLQSNYGLPNAMDGGCGWHIVEQGWKHMVGKTGLRLVPQLCLWVKCTLVFVLEFGAGFNWEGGSKPQVQASSSVCFVIVLGKMLAARLSRSSQLKSARVSRCKEVTVPLPGLSSPTLFSKYLPHLQGLFTALFNAPLSRRRQFDSEMLWSSASTDSVWKLFFFQWPMKIEFLAGIESSMQSCLWGHLSKNHAVSWGLMNSNMIRVILLERTDTTS